MFWTSLLSSSRQSSVVRPSYDGFFTAEKASALLKVLHLPSPVVVRPRLPYYTTTRSCTKSTSQPYSIPGKQQWNNHWISHTMGSAEYASPTRRRSSSDRRPSRISHFTVIAAVVCGVLGFQAGNMHGVALGGHIKGTATGGDEHWHDAAAGARLVAQKAQLALAEATRRLDAVEQRKCQDRAKARSVNGDGKRLLLVAVRAEGVHAGGEGRQDTKVEARHDARPLNYRPDHRLSSERRGLIKRR